LGDLPEEMMSAPSICVALFFFSLSSTFLQHGIRIRDLVEDIRFVLLEPYILGIVQQFSMPSIRRDYHPCAASLLSVRQSINPSIRC
jgi:hypothetical protein